MDRQRGEYREILSQNEDKVEQLCFLAEHNVDINFLTMESLILAQDERWRRASYMQVERESDFGQRKVADG